MDGNSRLIIAFFILFIRDGFSQRLGYQPVSAGSNPYTSQGLSVDDESSYIGQSGINREGGNRRVSDGSSWNSGSSGYQTSFGGKQTGNFDSKRAQGSSSSWNGERNPAGQSNSRRPGSSGSDSGFTFQDDDVKETVGSSYGTGSGLDSKRTQGSSSGSSNYGSSSSGSYRPQGSNGGNSNWGSNSGSGSRRPQGGSNWNQNDDRDTEGFTTFQEENDKRQNQNGWNSGSGDTGRKPQGSSSSIGGYGSRPTGSSSGASDWDSSSNSRRPQSGGSSNGGSNWGSSSDSRRPLSGSSSNGLNSGSSSSFVPKKPQGGSNSGNSNWGSSSSSDSRRPQGGSDSGASDWDSSSSSNSRRPQSGSSSGSSNWGSSSSSDSRRPQGGTNSDGSNSGSSPSFGSKKPQGGINSGGSNWGGSSNSDSKKPQGSDWGFEREPDWKNPQGSSNSNWGSDSGKPQGSSSGPGFSSSREPEDNRKKPSEPPKKQSDRPDKVTGNGKDTENQRKPNGNDNEKSKKEQADWTNLEKENKEASLTFDLADLWHPNDRKDFAWRSIWTRHRFRRENNENGCRCVDYPACAPENRVDFINFLKYNQRDLRVKMIECASAKKVCCMTSHPERKESDVMPMPTCGKRATKLAERDISNDGSANYGDYPWILRLVAGDETLCSASLIHSSVALTTASCALLLTGKDVRVRAGEWNVVGGHDKNQMTETTIGKVYLHPDFDVVTYTKDLALLFLSTPLQNANIVCLPSHHDAWNANECVVVGWTKKNGSGLKAAVLKQVDLEIVAQGKCRHRDGLKNGLSDLEDPGFMCAHTRKDDLYLGDVGASLFCPLYNTDALVQVGFVSNAILDKRDHKTETFTDILDSLDWVYRMEGIYTFVVGED